MMAGIAAKRGDALTARRKVNPSVWGISASITSSSISVARITRTASSADDARCTVGMPAACIICEIARRSAPASSTRRAVDTGSAGPVGSATRFASIALPLPDIEGRLAILNVHSQKMHLDDGVDLREIAYLTDGKNGADLRAICMEAGMFAIRKDHDAITRSDFLNAIEKIGLDFDRQKFASSFGAMFA